jgi:hypothetical protein
MKLNCTIFIISCILLVCQHAKLKLNTNKNVTAPTCKFQSHFTSVVGLALKVNKSRPVQKYLFILLHLGPKLIKVLFKFQDGIDKPQK